VVLLAVAALVVFHPLLSRVQTLEGSENPPRRCVVRQPLPCSILRERQGRDGGVLPLSTRICVTWDADLRLRSTLAIPFISRRHLDHNSQT
jgi:hypothetical protein